mmetsp:Transcript_94782/g.164470  ORF Transcript_94782/g.164470 Transcript_94782/m.164470 type:complete len:225 (-) Transcript_94782:13-687(-)
MAQVFDIHLIRVSPLRSISERSYFLTELTRCEKAKMAQLARRRKVANLLYSVKSVRETILLLGGAEEEELDLTEDVPEDEFVDEIVPMTMTSAPIASTSRRAQASRHGRRVTHVGSVNFTRWQDKDEVAHCAPLDPEAMEPPPKRQEDDWAVSGTWAGDMVMAHRNTQQWRSRTNDKLPSDGALSVFASRLTPIAEPPKRTGVEIGWQPKAVRSSMGAIPSQPG